MRARRRPEPKLGAPCFWCGLLLQGNARLGITGTRADTHRLLLAFRHAEQRLAVLAFHQLPANFVRNSQNLAAAEVGADKLTWHGDNVSTGVIGERVAPLE